VRAEDGVDEDRATSAPASCTTTYGPTSAHRKRRTTASENVTAGLMCAPEVVPNR
jgi:hypothetical protein